MPPAELTISFTLDGETHTVQTWTDYSALATIRLVTGRKRMASKCEMGLCGTCEALVDGETRRLCSLPPTAIDGATIEAPQPVDAPFRWPRPGRLEG
jgi:aerobic-type carbon monoxide dehydrogenase small subunit (CoxS/CutS family)